MDIVSALISFAVVIVVAGALWAAYKYRGNTSSGNGGTPHDGPDDSGDQGRFIP